MLQFATAFPKHVWQIIGGAPHRKAHCIGAGTEAAFLVLVHSVLELAPLGQLKAISASSPADMWASFLSSSQSSVKGLSVPAQMLSCEARKGLWERTRVAPSWCSWGLRRYLPKFSLSICYWCVTLDSFPALFHRFSCHHCQRIWFSLVSTSIFSPQVDDLNPPVTVHHLRLVTGWESIAFIFCLLRDSEVFSWWRGQVLLKPYASCAPFTSATDLI